MTDAETLVRACLAAMEARDLPAAQAMLAPGFAMVFPGDVHMTSLAQVLEWAAPRYRFVRKTFDRFDAAGEVVYITGTLYGEWPDGTPFDGIRYVDRFEIAEGRLIRQDVWNDMGEIRPR